MEVATTNNHHHTQSHPHHHHSHQLLPHQSGDGSDGARSPFQREVREWQRIDPDTGALLSGRLEADRWINGPLNSYGKISDSQNISQPNGTQHTQRKQLEVLQARTATGGAMQVIRSQTVQTTSSRWSSASASATPSPQLTLTNGSGSGGGGGGTSSYHNHSHYHNHPSSHLHSHPHLAETQTPASRSSWLTATVAALPASSSQMSGGGGGGVDICEVSDDDDQIEADQNYLINSSSSGGSSSNSFLNRHSFTHGNNNNNNNISSSHLGSSNLLLLDTAPSLKLSNLMKSSSSISSSSTNSTTAASATALASTTTLAPATAMNNTSNSNTHKSAGKISLHAIVSNNNNNNNNNNTNGSSDKKSSSSSTATTSATTPTTSWQQQRSSRLYEQASLFGKRNNNNNNNNNSNNSLTKSRVGVTNVDREFDDHDDDDDAGNRGGAGGGGFGDAATATDLYAADEQLRRHHQRHSSDELTPTHRRRDLESFRHYNDHGIAASASNDIDDDDLHSSSRYQRRQQIPLNQQQSTLERSRSISTDDLSTEWDTHGGSTEEPSEWRRVSKLRRSFQSTSTTNESSYKTPTITRRPPLDLPTNSVSVSRIRAELENGRRLNTAMRNNHIDLAALDTLLNATTTEMKPAPTKRTTYNLTAESLKEIRGKLKKLSDESLYREDFMCQPERDQLTALEQIEVRDVKHLIPERKLRQLTPEQSPEITPPKSAFQFVARQQQTISPLNSPTTQRNLTTSSGQKHTTNSLESRQKYKDTSATDWHMRRKSYGFEKMSPPDDKTMFGMDASTDSGLGRSGELGNWSPTESTTAVRGTVIQFGKPAKLVSNTAVQRRYRQLKSPAELKLSRVDADEEAEDAALKRHSIAVDESQYMRDNLRKKSQVHLNGFYDSSLETTGTKSLQPTRFDSSIETTTTTSSLFQRNSQQKRVEFCKTEVHFAAESGRVNIVETDGKPPPTNNFRRRRRTSSGPLQSLVKSATTVSSSSNSSVALPITHFGDDHRRKTIATTTVAYKASLVDAVPEFLEPSSNVTVSIPKVIESSSSYSLTESSRNSYASTSGVDTTDCEADELSAIRGILKNKPIKPKPYHLGENIDSTDALWGVQLKPIGVGSFAPRRESVSSAPKADSPPNKSVAERVRIVEKRQDHLSTSQSNGYSTKINLSLGEAQKEWSEPGVHDLTQRRPSAQELMLQDLREHQRILDEGLKSTSLIIKTMRSANEFDEAMRRLSIASVEAAVIPPIVVPTPMLRSNSYQESTRRYSNTSLDSNERQLMKSASYSSTSSLVSSTVTRKSSTDSTYSFFIQPVAAPRLKLLGNTDIPVSQQLSQLRRMYDRAASQDEDSADEEVKSYFRGHYDTSDSGGGTQESSSLEDERSIEYSSSWSRLKAKRTVWKIEADEKKFEKTLERTELPKSNVMSIELHSPKETLKAIPTTPVAKPRTISSAQQTAHPQVHTATTVKQSTLSTTTTTTEPNAIIKEPLKIIKEARGARKLRDHELSYFGVPPNKSDNNNEVHKTKLLPTSTMITNPKRSLPSRSRSHSKATTITESEAKQTTKWQLINDKPDLLRHSPIAVEPQVISRTAEIKPTERKSLQSTHKQRKAVSNINESDEELNDLESDDYDEHFYENITNELTPVFKVKSNAVKDTYSYDRKMDLKRDAMILSEMTRNADQTLKAITDEAALKDQRRRSLQRRNSKPLETIDEKTIAEKINDSCIAVKVSRNTHATMDTKRSSRHSTPSPTLLTTIASRARSSSQSSVESCPRARSRSLSSEREYENIKLKPTTRTSGTLKSKSSKPAVGSRSSSHESLRSSRSSGDEIVAIRRDERERMRTKTKRISSSNGITTASSTQSQSRDKVKGKEHERRERKYQTSAEKQQQRASSTVHSSQKERIECSTEPHLHHSQQHHRSSGVTESASGRRRRDETDLRKSSARSSSASVSRRGNEKHDERSTTRVGSSSRGHEHDSTQRSSHRLERSDKDKEKLSRSKGHSSRSKSERHPSASTLTKTREHKKTIEANSGETKHNDDTMTHSKNAQMINGHQYGHHQGYHQQHQQSHQQHPITTTTIAAKHHRERSGKDRK